jgi:hypothetical protein
MYSLFEFTSLLSFLIFYEIRKKDLLSQASVPKSSLSRPWLHWLWLISLVIVILSHYVGLYVAGVQILIFACMRDWHKSKKGKAALFLILSVGLLALLKIIHSLSLKHLGWQNIKFTNEPLARFPLEISLHLTHLSYLALIWYLLLIGLCIVPLKNFKLRIQPEAQLLLGFTALTLLLGTAATWVTQRGLLIPRYYIFLNPVFIILTVSLWQSLKSWLKYALILVSLIFSLGWLPKTYFPVKAPWNRLAQTVLENQGEIVFTTRTLTIATPYFNNARIKVEKLDLTDEGLRSLVELVHQGRKIWIVENYWGQMNYFSKLTSKLTELGIKFDYQEFENDYSERLSAIRLY